MAKDTGESLFFSHSGALPCKNIYFESFDELSYPLVKAVGTPSTHTPPEVLVTNRGRPGVERSNQFCYNLLNKYPSLESVAFNYPFIDDIVEGVCALDWGGVRGLVPWKLFLLISTMPVITSHEVRVRTWMSERHSRRLAEALRLCAEAIESEFRKRVT
ncbi:hypothetical protein [Aquitalea pelogenes]|uniref:hypothetical protein n=1 Tax=Aquitalea pelogenes TaxID=1293573 RepID=UPI0035B13534